jgi:transposase InsO family protein
MRIARENPRWGAKRLRGELLSLGFEVGAETVRRYRLQARRHPPSQSWRTFLANHAPHIWACDFFTVHTATFKNLYVFFLIDHRRRAIVHFNVTRHPTADWTWRQVIEATPWGVQPQFLIRDRDACFGKNFVARARDIGIETILTPFRAPKANAIAERMVGTFRRECLDHIIVLNERHLISVVSEFVEHYNASRPHDRP